MIFSKSNNLIYFLIGAIILLIPALSNNYPFVYSDTGAYINTGFTNTVPNDRPIFYGWFIRHLSLKQSLWFPVFFQSLFIFYYIHLVVKYYSNFIYKKAFSLFIALILCLTTGIGLFAGKLMPDIFTPIIILSAFLLFYDTQLTKKEKVIVSVIMFYGLLVHISHLMIVVLFILSVVFFSLIKYRKQISNLTSVLKRLYLISGIVLISGLTIPTTSYFNYGKFEMSKGSHVFLMARLSESGILKMYLDDECSSNHNVMCDYKDELPSSAVGFLWTEESPFYKTGSWENSKKEYNQIIKSILFSPKYWKYLFVDFTKQTFKQFFTFSPGTIVSHREDSPPYWEIENKMKLELNEYKNSLQFSQGYDITDIARRQNILFYFSLFILITCFFTVIFQNTNLFTNSGIFTIVYLLLLNAFVCGALANVVDRLQGRVVWILPMVSLIILTNYILDKKYPHLIDKK